MEVNSYIQGHCTPSSQGQVLCAQDILRKFLLHIIGTNVNFNLGWDLDG